MSKVKMICAGLLLFLFNFCSGQITSPAPYCSAGYDDAAGFPVDHYISNVSIGTLSNSTGAVQFAAPHYAYYNSIAAPSLTQGSSYSLSVTHDGGASIHFVVVYIDFNHNNSFVDAGERVLQQTIATGGTISNPATASVTIPMTAVVGTTRMRVMVFEDDGYTWTGGATNATPCTADASGSLDWGETEDYNVNIVAASSSCAEPSGLAATGISTSGATLSWSSASGAIGYEYVVNTTSLAPTGSGIFTASTSAPASGLTPGTTYYVHVRTKCSATSFSTWVTQSFTTLPLTPVCDTASTLTASGITTISANLSWVTVAGSVGYEYVVDMSAASPTGSGMLVTTTAAAVSGLTPATTYYAHVRNKCSATSFSAWITRAFTTLPATCDTAGGITLSGVTTTGATVSWGGVAGATGYEYIVSTSPLVTTGTVTTATTVPVTSLSPSTLYYVRVRTLCSSGAHSAWTTRTFTTQALVICNTPTTLAVSGITTTKAIISWTRVSGSLRYEYAVNGSPASPSSSVSTTDTVVTFTMLTPEATYYAHVRNVCGGGVSEWVTKPFKTTLGVTEVNKNTPIVSAYPNPATGSLKVKITGAVGDAGVVQLSDVAGKVVETVKVTGDEITIDTEQLAAGIYFIRYSDQFCVQFIKILKQ